MQRKSRWFCPISKPRTVNRIYTKPLVDCRPELVIRDPVDQWKWRVVRRSQRELDLALKQVIKIGEKSHVVTVKSKDIYQRKLNMQYCETTGTEAFQCNCKCNEHQCNANGKTGIVISTWFHQCHLEHRRLMYNIDCPLLNWITSLHIYYKWKQVCYKYLRSPILRHAQATRRQQFAGWWWEP